MGKPPGDPDPELEQACPCDPPPRKHRHSFNIPGHAHELTFSCVNRWKLLSGNRSRRWVVQALSQARSRWGIKLWGYVIMPEHVHALIYPDGVEVETVLKSIKQSVARKAVAALREEEPAWLERLRVVWPSGRVEHRFWQQGGGYDRNVHQRATARQMLEYIHNNPVRRGLVEAPTDWPWSSARWYAGWSDAMLEMDRFY